MGKVIAKEDCYLGPEHGGYKEKGETFEYGGPPHDSLEAIKSDRDDVDTAYHKLTREELRAELDRRQIAYAPNAGEKNLRGLLEADDDK